MAELLRYLIKFYGNRGLLFDCSISLLFTILGFYIIPAYGIKLTFENEFFYSMIEFLGILAGFLLTAFSLLYIYNPTEAKDLSKFRKHPMFIRMLKVFLTTILFILLSVICIYTKLSANPQILFFNHAILFVLLITILRIVKCFYYLYVIVDLGNLRNTRSNID